MSPRNKSPPDKTGSSYGHFHLEAREIRIIVLEPASDISSDIQCGLHKTSLDYVIDFEALSYTWGDPEAQHPINCRTVHNLDDDSYTPFDSLLVTKNCLDALHALRHPSRRRLLWIDAICIDQGNQVERNTQVTMMGEIYAACRGVVVWLGHKDEVAEQAFRFLLHVGKLMEDIKLRNSGRELVEPEVPVFEDIKLQEKIMETLRNLQQLSKEQYDSESEHPLRTLLNRPWFHRMWTVQEVVMPPENDVTIQCGDLQAWLPTLLLVARNIEKAEFTKIGVQASMRLQLTLINELSQRRRDGMARAEAQGSNALQRGFQGYMKNYSHVLHYYNQGDGNRKFEIKLSAILDAARKKGATVAHDKVFALYGVLQELGISMPAPDYGKPVREVFYDAAVASMESEWALDVLYLAVTRTRDKKYDLPSWVPDLTDPGFGIIDPRNFAEDAKRFTAGSSFSSTWGFSRPHRLQVWVKLVGTVTRSFCSFDVHVESLLGHDDNLGRSPTTQASLAKFHEAFLLLRTWVGAVRNHAANHSSRKEMIMSFLKVLFHEEKSCVEHAEEEDRFDKWFSILEKNDLELMQTKIIRREKEKSEKRLAKVAQYEGSSVLKQLKSWKTRASVALDEREVSSKSFAVDVLSHTAMHNVTFPAMEPVLQLHLAVLRWARRQAFFTTDHRRFGSAPDCIAAGAVREGDRIAVFPNLGMPLVLRPRTADRPTAESNEYELVSYCYQDGIMHGEAARRGYTETVEVVLV